MTIQRKKKGVKKCKSQQKLQKKLSSSKKIKNKPQLLSIQNKSIVFGLKKKKIMNKSKSIEVIKIKFEKNKKNNMESRSNKVKKSKVKTKLKEISQISQKSKNKEKDRVENMKQYFLYHHNYISIENSEQRKFVHKINLIDLSNKSTGDQFQIKDMVQFQNQNQNNHQNKLSQSEQNLQHQNFKLQKLPLQCIQPTFQAPALIDLASQTQTLSSNRTYIEDNKKCFTKTLTQLQFLYLPDDSNFINFTSVQREHYQQMLQTVAKKLKLPTSVSIHQNKQRKLQEFHHNTINQECAHLMIYQRECIQLGHLQYYPSSGFPTHLPSIMAYLSQLTNFITKKHLSFIISLLNTIYHQNCLQKLQSLRSYEIPPLESNFKIINQQIYIEFEEQLFKDYQFPSNDIIQYIHFHNKAIFDTFMEHLQHYQPYYEVNGEPFPWQIMIDMKVYEINSDSIHIIFNQIQNKIKQYISILAGLIIDNKQDEICNTKSIQNDNKQANIANKNNNEMINQLHLQKLENNEQIYLNQEFKFINDKPVKQWYNLQLLLEITSSIEMDLWIEISLYLEN